MAKIGLRHLVAAEIDTQEIGVAPTYKTGFKIGKMLSADVSIEVADNPLHADDGVAETDKSFTSGTFTVGVDDLGDTPAEGQEIEQKLLGEKIVEVGGVMVTRSSGQTSAPDVGIGYIRVKKLRGILYYVATWLYKVQFGTPSESSTTKGESIEWQTPELEGNIMVVEDFEENTYRDKATFNTLAEAIAWVDGMANMSSVVDKTTLDATIATAEGKEAETYTSISYADMFVALLGAKNVNTNKFATQAMVGSANTALNNAITALEERV